MAHRALAFAALAMLAAGWGASPPASAQSSLTACFNVDGGTPLDLRIEDCTNLIRLGRLPKSSLAIAHQNRGTAYVGKGDLTRAIQDRKSTRLNSSH